MLSILTRRPIFTYSSIIFFRYFKDISMQAFEIKIVYVLTCYFGVLKYVNICLQDLGLSSACLLVEAAVGSVESAFKLPKTKKTMATEWIGRSPERTPSPYTSPYRPPLMSAPSLESLVRVASTMIGDLSGNQDYHEDRSSPPRTPGRERNRPPKKAKRITRSTPPVEVAEVIPVQHSAKKRWLRQAISEESDSPSAGEKIKS